MALAVIKPGAGTKSDGTESRGGDPVGASLPSGTGSRLASLYIFPEQFPAGRLTNRSNLLTVGADHRKGVHMRRASTAVLAMTIISFLLAGLPQGALAAEFTVNTTADGEDLSTADPICDASVAPGRQCTLRAAIEQTNARPGRDTVILPSGTYTIDSGSFFHHTVSDDLIIDGGG